MILSASNIHVKHLRSLRASPRERRAERSLVIEGVRLVAEALAAGAELRVALYNPGQLGSTSGGASLLERLAGQPDCHEAGEIAIDAAADTRSPQGVVAAVAWPEIAARPGI